MVQPTTLYELLHWGTWLYPRPVAHNISHGGTNSVCSWADARARGGGVHHDWPRMLRCHSPTLRSSRCPHPGLRSPKSQTGGAHAKHWICPTLSLLALLATFWGLDRYLDPSRNSACRHPLHLGPHNVLCYSFGQTLRAYYCGHCLQSFWPICEHRGLWGITAS